MKQTTFHRFFKYFLLLIFFLLMEHIYASILYNGSNFSALRDIPLITLSTDLICLLLCVIPSKKTTFLTGSCLLTAISSLCIFPLSDQPIHLYDIYAYIGFWTEIAGLFIAAAEILQNRLLRNLLTIASIFILFIPAICLWSYFRITHSWIKSSTILAICQTNFQEGLNYISLHSSSFLLLLILIIFLTGICIWFLKFDIEENAFVAKGPRTKWFSIISLSFAGIFLIYSCRENLFTDIYTDSKYYLDSYKQYILQKDLRQSQMQSLAAQLETKPASGVYVLVIGESENKLHMGAYGYSRDTTPWLSSIKNDDNVLLFKNAFSCYSQTVQVLAYALTAKNQYNSIPLEKAPSIIESAHAAGYDTVWISNQMQFGIYDTPTSYIAASADKTLWLNNCIGNTSGTRIQTSAYDESVIQGLKQLQPSDHLVIVIHLMGNHFPYNERYPRSYELYHGRNNTIDSYDNSILYNDYVVSKIYNTVKTFPHFQAMLYFSDHGEGIDNGFTHDAVNFIPPMTYTPMYVIFSPDYMINHSDIYHTLKSHRDDYFTNDLIYNAAMGIMDIQIPSFYEPENDITSAAYDSRPERFLTMYGTKKIANQSGN